MGKRDFKVWTQYSGSCWGNAKKISISFDLNDFEFFEDGKVDRVTVDMVIGDLSDREPSSKNGPSEENELSPIITAE